MVNSRTLFNPCTARQTGTHTHKSELELKYNITRTKAGLMEVEEYLVQACPPGCWRWRSGSKVCWRHSPWPAWSPCTLWLAESTWTGWFCSGNAAVSCWHHPLRHCNQSENKTSNYINLYLHWLQKCVTYLLGMSHGPCNNQWRRKSGHLSLNVTETFWESMDQEE